MKNTKTTRLVTGAVILALSTILSFVSINRLPFGGSLTLLSMLPICLYSYRYGLKWGFGVSFTYSVIQLAMSIGEAMSWGLTPAFFVGMIVLDYLLAYTVLGLGGLFRRLSVGLPVGVFVALSARYLCHIASGVLLWKSTGEVAGIIIDNVWLYSLAYNGLYMIPELIATTVAALLLSAMPQMRKWMAPTL
jgi:thiamine transporter